jgi:hypothetical protein
MSGNIHVYPRVWFTPPTHRPHSSTSLPAFVPILAFVSYFYVPISVTFVPKVVCFGCVYCFPFGVLLVAHLA